MERQESLPKIIAKTERNRQNNHAAMSNNHNQSMHSHSHSISPNNENYRRPCKCSRKH